MGLKVYIDNEEIPVKKGDRETIGPIIQEINKILATRKKVVNSIYINGRFLKENIIYNLDDTIIEVETVSETEFIMNGLRSVDTYCDQYFDVLEELSECEYGNPLSQKYENELILIAQWFLNLLEILKEDLAMEQEIPELEVFIETLKREFIGVKEIMKQGDEDCLYEILENDIAEVIYDFSNILEDVIKLYSELKVKMKLLN